MERVVIAVDDDLPGRVALDWLVERARSRPLQVRLVHPLDPDASNPDAAKEVLALAANRIQDAAPETQLETVLTHRPLLHDLLEQSVDADLLVIGAHPDPGIRESRTPSFPVSLAARSRCPVVIVPDDWEPRGGPVIVGVDASGTALEAAAFAAREAIAADRDLEIVHTWEPWAGPNTRTDQFEHEGALTAIVERVRAEYPAARVHGVLREAVAHNGIIASARDASLVVLGTHGLGRETGLVLGTIHQEVMMRGGAPLCIVPLAQAEEAPAQETPAQETPADEAGSVAD
ncbi:MAG: hypothetical protein JWP32_31 [Schumannella sp.]|nr:hypothetical protein [Schumannella sp.]